MTALIVLGALVVAYVLVSWLLPLPPERTYDHDDDEDCGV